MIADQRHHLHEQLKQLKLGIFSQRISIALKGPTALVGLMAVIALAAVVWNATHAEGLVIDSFSVPPDSGMTAKDALSAVIRTIETKTGHQFIELAEVNLRRTARPRKSPRIFSTFRPRAARP